MIDLRVTSEHDYPTFYHSVRGEAMNLKLTGALAAAIGLALCFAATSPITGQEQDFGNARGGRGGAPRAPAGPVKHLPDGRPDMRGRWNAPPLFNSNILEAHPGGFGI